MSNTNTVDSAAAARADRDDAAIRALGIVTKDESGNTETFFAHGTEMCGAGKDKARAGRREFLSLPTVEDGMDNLIATVQREQRADHFVDLGSVLVGNTGAILTSGGFPIDAEGKPVTGERPTRLAALTATEVGWQRLASFAPANVPSKLRTNVNAWTSTRPGDLVRFRTRLTPESIANPDGTQLRELASVVGMGYIPYDLDAIAADIAELMPQDARTRVRYDGSRARIDVILQNPHHYPDSTGTASVGEAHRLMLRITSADDGTGGFRLRWSAERIRCINCTLLKGDHTVFTARHTRDDLIDTARSALRAQGIAAEGFQQVWRDAWTSYYLDGTRKGDPLEAEEALRRMVFHGLVRIPGLKKPDVWAAVKAAWDAEPGDGANSVAAIHNAITRAAHEADGARSWADDDVEEQAAELLYQKVHVLAEIPEDARAEMEW